MSDSLILEAKALVQGEPNLIANLANISALLMQNYAQLNWCGFYLLDSTKNELVLGPFQGKVACLRIPFAKGVCGTAWTTGLVQNVANVHEIPNHIACDVASQSELVIPIFKNKEFKAVLDIDSPKINRFSLDMQNLLTRLANEVLADLF